MESVRLACEQLLDALSRHDWKAIRRACLPDYIHHAPGVPEAGLEKYLATLQLVVEAVPDMTLEIQQIVVTEEYATLRYTVHGTHLAEKTKSAARMKQRPEIRERKARTILLNAVGWKPRKNPATG